MWANDFGWVKLGAFESSSRLLRYGYQGIKLLLLLSFTDCEVDYSSRRLHLMCSLSVMKRTLSIAPIAKVGTANRGTCGASPRIRPYLSLLALAN